MSQIYFYHYIKVFTAFWRFIFLLNWKRTIKRNHSWICEAYISKVKCVYTYILTVICRGGGEMTNAILKITTFENLYGILHCICMFNPWQLRSQKITRNLPIYIWILLCKYTVWSQTKTYRIASLYSKWNYFQHRSLSTDRNEAMEITSRFRPLFSSL